MAQEIRFTGGELELLAALDASGCVLTDENHFLCTMEGDKLPFNSRLPVQIRGEFASGEKGFRIRFRVLPAPRMVCIGALLLAASFGCLMGGNPRGAVLFGILAAAIGVNFAGQKKSCLRRFAGTFGTVN